MYKKVFLMILAAVFTANVVSAQLFVGGSLGFDFMGGKNIVGSNKTDMPSTFAFQIAPRVGYYLNDDFAIGLEVGLTTSTQTTPRVNLDDIKRSTTGWNVRAFARYNLLGTERLSLLLEGGIAIGGIKSKTTIGAITTDSNPISFFNIGVLPVLSYSLSDRLSLEASADLLRLGFSSVTETNAGNSNLKDRVNLFGFGVNTSNLIIDGDNFGNSSLFRVGLVFRF